MCETLSVQEPMCGGHAGAVWLECISAGQLCVREDTENLIRRRKTNTVTKEEGEISLRAWNESVIVGVTICIRYQIDVKTFEKICDLSSGSCG